MLYVYFKIRESEEGMNTIAETLDEMIREKSKQLKGIENVMIEKYKKEEDYTKELDQCTMLKAEIEEALIRLQREIKTS